MSRVRPGNYQRPMRTDAERDVLLARVLALSETEQLWIHRELAESLGGRLGRETQRARQARLRHEALETIHAAAAYLGLPVGQAPSIPEFRKAAKETTLPMTFSGVYEAFENNWELIARIYRGETIPRTSAQRAALRAIVGKGRTDKEAPLSCVRLFLNQSPPPRSTGGPEYRAWAQETNENLPEGWQRLIEDPDHIRSISRTTWDNCLAVARNEKTLEEAQQQTLAAYLSESGPLVGHWLASWVLGISGHKYAHTLPPGYPEPVVCLGRTNWLWLLSDIRAYGEGERDFTHARGHLQQAYVDSDELAAKLNIRQESVRGRLVKAERKGWDKVPKPTGRAGKRLYWERAVVERWFQEHPTAPYGSGSRGRPRKHGVSEISGHAT